MSYQAGRPENVLRRAEDLIGINQPDDALQTMFTFINAKRTKNLDPSTPELLEILKLFIKLAVNKRLSKYIKEAFYQYKKMCIENPENLKNLEEIIKYFLNLSNSKLIEAQSKANSAAELAIEESVASAAAATKTIEQVVQDNDVAQDADEEEEEEEDGLVFNVSPENILLSSVSTDDSTDRSNKEFFLPWLKFVWESYRTVLELLKGNKYLEISYCQIIHQSFQFCIKFDRKSEFKRLCEILKTHLMSMSKPEYEDAVNLAKPLTLQRFLDTRFEQLNTAVKLELWKESFKSIEEVHTLMKLCKNSPKPILLINYYKNLAKIFQVSNNYIYATASRQKLFQLLIKSPVITENELKLTASIHLITALSIPISENLNHSFSIENNLIDEEFLKRKNIKLSSLLTLNEIPTRDNLLNGYTLKNVLNLADSNLVKLFNLLEKNFNPLTFSINANKILNDLANDDKYISFIEQLKKVINYKIISKISTLYDSIKFDFLFKLCTFENNLFNFNEFEFEDLIINSQYIGLINSNVEIDDESGVIKFNDKLYSNESNKIGSKLFNLEKALTNSILLINLDETKSKRDELKSKLFKIANEKLLAEKEAMLQTIELVNEHKEQLEKELEAKKLEEEKLSAEEALKQRKLEEERLKEDAEKRERAKHDKLMKTIALESKKKLVKDINEQGIIFINFDDVKNMTDEEIKELKKNKIIEQNDKLEEQVKAIVKRADHIERAERLTEMNLVKEEMDKEIIKQREEYDLLKEQKILQAKQSFDEDIKIKERLLRIVPDFKEYVNNLESLESNEKAERENKIKEAFENAKKERIAEFIAHKKKEFDDAIKLKEEEAKIAAERAESERAEARSWRRTESPSMATPPPSRSVNASSDPDRELYDSIKVRMNNGEKISMSDKMKFRRLKDKFE